MNTGSKLDISKSSLLSLKAELARKHEEASKAKAQAQGNYIKPLARTSKSSIFSRSNLGLEDRQQNDIPEFTQDEEAKIRRSRSALEEKAKIYDSLSHQSSSDHDSQYLVNFAQKSADASQSVDSSDEEEKRKREKEEEEEEARRAGSDDYDAPSDPEDDWVDFSDSLGRTRRCLRRDLSRFRELDDRLLRSLEAKNNKSQEEDENLLRSGPLPPGGLPPGCAAPDLLSDDMRREQQRLKWEEEEANLQRKSDIHYQDVLFEEARTHGVGYFPFARDEGTRRAQQDDLKKLRKETVQQQKAALTQRERRDQLMRARLRAAHNRKRARDGLPPLGDDEELPSDKKEEPEEVEEPAPSPVATVQKAKGPRPRPSPSVRPWDIGKEGVPVLSQAEWNEQQRAHRKQEFAPPSFYEDRDGDRKPAERRPERRRKPRPEKDDDNDDDVGPGPPAPSRASPPPSRPTATASPPPGPLPPPSLGPSAWFSVPPPSFMPPVHLPPPSMAPWPPQPVPRPMAAPPPPPGVDEPAGAGQADDARGGLYFSSKRAKHDWRAVQEVRLPMEEEEVFEEPPPPGVVDDSPPPGPPGPPPRPSRRQGQGRQGGGADRVGAEIAPPPTLEYFGPSESASDRSRKAGQRAPGPRPSEDSLSASISAGLQFLRKQAEDKEKKRSDKGWADFV